AGVRAAGVPAGSWARFPAPPGPPGPAMGAFPDARRRLRRSAITLHADRPGLGLGAVGLADRRFRRLARACRADLRADQPALEDGLPRPRAHGCDYSRSRQPSATPLGLGLQARSATQRLWRCGEVAARKRRSRAVYA